jgi:universal stress protein A
MFEPFPILAPTDFSKHSKAAVRYAVVLAKLFGAPLHLIHVLNPVMPVMPDGMIGTALPPDYYRDLEAESQAALQRVIDPSWDYAPSVTRAVLWGDAVGQIIDYATEHQVGTIVIATHGRTGLSHLLLGSVAERIVREAPCSVMIARDRSA